MLLRQVEYRGMIIHAGTLEVAGSGRFLPVLRVRRAVADPLLSENSWLLDVPCPDELFATAEEAAEAALEFARAVIDGEVPGLRIDLH